MQIIFVVRQNNNFLEEIQDSDIIFGTYHRRNSIYLERENELDKFSVLPSLDDTSPTMISMLDRFTLLLKDLYIVLEETHKARDTEMTLHILELIVLCKFCVWNPQKYWLKFTPWGNVMPPTALPENVRLSISGLAPILEK
ncbi:hypothetical protein [uncultured Bartonella sp.]|uniref:hypothetical protein n=1 Tax=uncultured Bartonella sp. TaxID=104108 RepID=UPI002626B938|nr:hypothetical protein [uncultured Bartonella sp.]